MSDLLRGVFGVLAAGLIAAQPLAALADATPASEQWPLVPVSASAPAQDAPQVNDQPIVPPQLERQVIAQSPGRPASPYRHPYVPLWRPGWEYTLDASIAAPFGNTGKPKAYGLPGAMDVVLKYAFSESSRLYLSYFGLQEYPIGFNTGIVPVYLQGVAVPIGTVNLNAPAGLPGPVNSSVNNKIMISRFDQVFWVGGPLGKLVPGGQMPIIVSPAYTERWGLIGGQSDLLPIEIDGLPYQLHYRTGSYVALGVTLPVPILTQPQKHLITSYTIGPQWSTGLAGANVTNKAQLIQILRTTWKPTEQWTIDLEPSLYPNLLPTDKWAQHYLTMQYSVAYSFGKDRYNPYHRPITHNLIPFIQVMVSMGGAMNVSPYGISALYCQQLNATGCNPLAIVPQLGGNHAAQVQLKFGIGRPEVIPF